MLVRYVREGPEADIPAVRIGELIDVALGLVLIAASVVRYPVIGVLTGIFCFFQLEFSGIPVIAVNLVSLVFDPRFFQIDGIGVQVFVLRELRILRRGLGRGDDDVGLRRAGLHVAHGGDGHVEVLWRRLEGGPICRADYQII